MSDTKTQLRRYWEHLDDSHGPVSLDDVLLRASEVESAIGVDARRMGRFRRRSGWVRPVLVFSAAFVVVIVTVGIVALVITSPDGSSPVGEQPPAVTEAPTVPSVATTVAPLTTEAPAPSETQPPVDAAPEVAFDPASEGTPAGTLDTPLGGLSLFTLDRVSYKWVEAGFPGPYGEQPDRDFWRIWGDTHSGLEVFATDAGYLGLGSTAEPSEPRIMLGYRDLLVRVRGAATREDVVQWDAEHGVNGMERWFGGWWWTFADDPDENDFYFSALEEVWFSRDGSDWSQVSPAGFGEGAAIQSQPTSVAYHDGTWIVIGWADVDEPLGYRQSIDGSPAAWMSDDLVTWTRVPFDFPSTGTDTQLTQVVAGDRGWIIVASSRYDGDRPTTASSLWMSADGLAWEELRVEDITGLPGCPYWKLIRKGEQCHIDVHPSFVPGGIALYTDVPTFTQGGAVTSTWRLWLGLWDD